MPTSRQTVNTNFMLVPAAAGQPEIYLGAVLIDLQLNKDSEGAFRIYMQLADKRKPFAFPLEVYLDVLRFFFVRPWTHFVPGVPQITRALILDEVGYLLQAVGRVIEAQGPKERAVRIFVEAEMWTDAARSATRLCEYYLYSDFLQEALECGRNAVKCADKSGDISQQVYARIKLANAFKEAGELDLAGAYYLEALKLGSVTDFSLYLYGEYLFVANRRGEAKRVLEQVIATGRPHSQCMAKVLHSLIISGPNNDPVLREMEATGVVDELPRFLLWMGQEYYGRSNTPAARHLYERARDVAIKTGLALFARKAQEELDKLPPIAQ